jgi:hypothetical protein
MKIILIEQNASIIVLNPRGSTFALRSLGEGGLYSFTWLLWASLDAVH